MSPETTTATHTGWVVKLADRYMTRPMVNGKPSEWSEDFRAALIVPSPHLHIKDREELTCFDRYELEPVWHTTFGEGDRMLISEKNKPAPDWADNRCSECMRQADATRKRPQIMTTRTRKKKAAADVVDVDHETITAEVVLAYDTDAGAGVTCGVLEDDESRVFLELVAEVDGERRGVRLLMGAHSVARVIRRLATVQAMILPAHV